MPKYSPAKVIEIFSVFVNITAIIYIVLNIKTMSISDPGVSILVYSLMATGAVYLIPLIISRIKNRIYKGIIFLIAALFLLEIVMIWIKISTKEMQEPIVKEIKPGKTQLPIIQAPDSLEQKEKPTNNSDYKDFLKYRYISGIVIPPSLITSGKGLVLKCASNEYYCPIDSLRKGTYLESFMGDPGGHNPLNLKMRVVGNKLLITSTFRDLEHYEVVGKLIDNNWVAVKDKILDYKCEKNNMEIIDNSDNVIFRLSFIAPNIIKYNGYYSGTYSICVMADDTMYLYNRDDPKYKIKALRALEHLKPILTHF